MPIDLHGSSSWKRCTSCMKRRTASIGAGRLLRVVAIWKSCGKHWLEYTHTHPFNGPFPGLPRWAGTRKGKPVWILLKQETVSGSGISWAICKSAPGSRQINLPAPHHSVFTDRMPFLPPNQQRQSTEGKNIGWSNGRETRWPMWRWWMYCGWLHQVFSDKVDYIRSMTSIVPLCKTFLTQRIMSSTNGSWSQHLRSRSLLARRWIKPSN